MTNPIATLDLPSDADVRLAAAHSAFVNLQAPASYYEDLSEGGPVRRFADRLIAVVVEVDDPRGPALPKLRSLVARVPNPDGTVRLDHTGAPMRPAAFLAELVNNVGGSAQVQDAEGRRYLRWQAAAVSVPPYA